MASLAPAPLKRPLTNPAAMTNVGAPVQPSPLTAPVLPASPAGPTAIPTGQFTPPDPSQMMNDPAFQARVSLSNRGAQRSAAAHGTLLSGGFQEELARLNQTLASEETDKIYGRALSTYDANRGTNAQNFGQNVVGYGAARDAYGDTVRGVEQQADTVNANNQAQQIYQQMMGDYRASLDAQLAEANAQQNAATTVANSRRAPLTRGPLRPARGAVQSLGIREAY